MIKCTHCGTSNPDGLTRCSNCDQSLTDGISSTTKPWPQPRFVVLRILMVLCSVLAVIALPAGILVGLLMAVLNRWSGEVASRLLLSGVLGGVLGFVVLRGVSELIQLLFTIEENTRKTGRLR